MSCGNPMIQGTSVKNKLDARMVRGCISLTTPLAELVGVIHLVVAGYCRFAVAARVQLAHATTDAANDPSLPTALTAREQQVSQYASQGMSNKRIADKLGVTVKTVESHLRSVFRKTGCSSRFLLSDTALNDEETLND